MSGLSPKAQIIGRQSRIYVGNALKTTRSTLQPGFMPI
jgi:hypothetical protein